VFNTPEYFYDVNYNASSNVEGDIAQWFLAAHYLSTCAAADVGTGDLTPIFLKCQPKTERFQFRTDDLFIVNFMANKSNRPVLDGFLLDTFNAAPAFVTLVLLFLVSSNVLVGEAFGWLKMGYVSQIPVFRLAVNPTFPWRSRKAQFLYCSSRQHF
jgi:hypothetical protein